MSWEGSLGWCSIYLIILEYSLLLLRKKKKLLDQLETQCNMQVFMQLVVATVD